ncbi:CLUMA_CG010421, isoform A [Clunio marinus]|uniref:CLUMA_CG010421, isoform A n=1 Tax=Clunio marinus TaxID=568069 RepID=A0A1J1IBA9_9DIPT|nr:CLUMA_CG010421, isoform A [Clunio marinus]
MVCGTVGVCSDKAAEGRKVVFHIIHNLFCSRNRSCREPCTKLNQHDVQQSSIVVYNSFLVSL